MAKIFIFAISLMICGVWGAPTSPPTSSTKTTLGTTIPMPSARSVKEDNWNTLADFGIWVSVLVLISAMVILILELIKRRREQKQNELKYYSFRINSINEGLFDRELHMQPENL